MGIIQAIFDGIFGKPIQKRSNVRAVPLKRNHCNMIMPDNTPLYLKRGWRRTKGNVYEGYYRTVYGAWKGAIERRGDKFKVFINDPPKERLKKHSRWECFHHVKGNLWWIHLAVNPKDGDISSIIYYVEKVINDSYRL